MAGRSRCGGRAAQARVEALDLPCTTLTRCPAQVSHAASTYAAILALASTGMRSALSVVRRGALYRWLLSMKREDGPFRMHADGCARTPPALTT